MMVTCATRGAARLSRIRSRTLHTSLYCSVLNNASQEYCVLRFSMHAYAKKGEIARFAPPVQSDRIQGARRVTGDLPRANYRLRGIALVLGRLCNIVW